MPPDEHIYSIRLNLRKMSEDFRKSKYFQEKVIIYMLGAALHLMTDSFQYL
jgi:hypothetical protein